MCYHQRCFEEMLKVLPGCRGEVVADAGHLVPGDNPRGFLQALEPFLSELLAK